MKRKIVPDIVKPREIISVSRDDKIIDAAAKMIDAHVAALVVFDDKENLVGIVTERDMTHRVVARGLDTPTTTTVSEIMTENPDTGQFRHGGARRDAIPAFPALAGNGRDLFAAVKMSLEEDVQETEAFVFGKRYGA